jgi:hypothetical protein
MINANWFQHNYVDKVSEENLGVWGVVQIHQLQMRGHLELVEASKKRRYSARSKQLYYSIRSH